MRRLLSAFIGTLARAIATLGNRFAPQTIWATCSAGSQRAALALFAYACVVHVVYDTPDSFGEATGPLHRIPRLKQTWTVMTQASQALVEVEIEVDLADATTCQVRPCDALDGSFDFTLPQASSIRSFWPADSIWPMESSRSLREDLVHRELRQLSG
jgi:hypothetical protein